MGASNQQNLNPVFELSRLPPNSLLNKIKTEILKKVGQHGVRGISNFMTKADKHKNQRLSR